jgi:arylsulfatase A-like enzyme
MDLFTTFSALAGVSVPKDRVMDGYDLGSTLFKNAPSPRKEVFYYRGTELYAARLGDYKAHYITQGSYGQFGQKEVHDTPILYNLNVDPSENFDISANHPEIIEEINTMVKEHQSKLVKGKDQLADRE